ncbi:guanylate kinase [Desulfocurvibacter africanus]|uniref:guanylate kinase n=1 Tax=Desulfocurvibacter africanus TaxID=873 RepID=UPI00041B83B8|nr:guanylate kinase [Desulfocurvibacter africanus]
MTSSLLGQAYIICAPSGTGKSTLIKRLLSDLPGFAFSVSCTTRAPRAGEVNGRDYHFVTRAEFERMRGLGHFAEWAEVHGNFYGTPLAEARALLESGRDIIFDIDVQGALQLKQTIPDGCFIFLLPPSRQALVERLSRRASDGPEVIARRLANARNEIRQAPEFQYLIVNADLDQAYAQLRAVVVAQKLAPERNPGLVDSILAGWSD